MKIAELLTEKLKSRIQHPEDMIFSNGSIGAINALNSLLDAASSSKNISIKFDGSPSLVAGNIKGHFVMTDKAAMTRQLFFDTPKKIYWNILDRKPDQAGRANYSMQVSELFNYIKRLIPKNFPGLIQFDVMWFSRPNINPETNAFEFQPNKVLYSIPTNSQLGQEISKSKYGIVVHSYFENPDDEEPRAIDSFESLGLIPVDGLVVLNPKASFEVKADPAVIKEITTLINYTKKNSNKLDTFLNTKKLESLGLLNLPQFMKMFLAARARVGSGSAASLQNDFISWVKSTPAISDKKKPIILDYIKKNINSYREVWAVVSSIVAVKDKLREKLDKLYKGIEAKINGVSSHEGYVIDSPTGKIKLVNRPLFMNDKTIGKFSKKI
jgi:hypothetical protein